MAKPKTSFRLSMADENSKCLSTGCAVCRTLSRSARSRFLRNSCQDHFCSVEPQINAEGVHVWNFDAACPLDVVFLQDSGPQKVRMNRHPYFEVLYLCSGSALYHIQDRLIPMRVGDLAVIGSTLYHRIERTSSAPLTFAALFFDPELIRGGGNDGIEYLTPFLFQDLTFPHIVPMDSGVPKRVLDMMLHIHLERPTGSASRLTMKTYLKMILAWLAKYYESYSGTVEAFHRQEKALERLRPLFNFLEENCGNSIQIKQAAKVCRMSDSHFMSVFKEVTGMSFLKYLNYYRIEKAQLMLAHTDASMKNLCQEVGFCDQSYFGMVFRKTVGMTPAEYRRRYRANAAPAPPQLSPRLQFEDVRLRLSNDRKQRGCFTGIENSESQSAGPSLALVV